jgi:hypothetical protein
MAKGIFLYLNKPQLARSKMKANHFLLAASMVLAMPAYAGFYFDAGVGFGIGSYSEEYTETYQYSNPHISTSGLGFGYGLGLRIGGGLSNVGSGLFFVGEANLEIIDHLIFNSNSNSLMVGPGIIFYPIRNLQLGTSFGVSSIKGEHENSYDGYAYNLSVAYDFGKSNHGLLLGASYYGTGGKEDGNEIKISKISVFVKYAFRRKKSALIADEELKQPKKEQQAINEPVPPQSSFRNFAIKNFDKIIEDNQNNGGEHLNSLILLMESEGIPKDDALILIKRAIRKSNGDAEGFANELESSAVK